MAVGLPDWQRGIAVNVSLQSPTSPSAFVVRPQGTQIFRDGALTNLVTYTTIVSYAPAAGRNTFLAKASAYCAGRTHFQTLTYGNVVGEAIIPADGWYVDFFPWGPSIVGNGLSTISIQALSLDGAETLHGILMCEDVLTG